MFATLGSIRIGEHGEIWGGQAQATTPGRKRRIRRRARVRRGN